MFSDYGDVEDARILTDLKTNQSRGVGFVHFKTKEAAASAVIALNCAIPANVSLCSIFKIEYF